MTTRRKAVLLASIILSGLLASPFAFAALATDKPEDIPWCGESSEGYCAPVIDDPAKAIPPDLPPAAKLRAQILKERKAHRAEVRALKAEIVRLSR